RPPAAGTHGAPRRFGQLGVDRPRLDHRTPPPRSATIPRPPGGPTPHLKTSTTAAPSSSRRAPPARYRITPRTLPSRTAPARPGSAGREGRGGARGRDRLLDHAGEGRSLPQPLPRLGRHLVLAAVDEREEEATVPEEGECPVDDPVDPLRGRLLRPRRALQLDAQTLDAVEHHGQEEVLLAREVPVEGALADPARLDDVVHLDLVVVVAGPAPPRPPRGPP